MTHSEEIRRYWRETQRRYRAAKSDSSKQSFTPRITRFELCSLCTQWHPTGVILGNGRILRFSLDSYHSRASIESWRNNLELSRRLAAGAEEKKPTAIELCVIDLVENEGYTEEEAKSECKDLIKDPIYRKKLLQTDTDKKKHVDLFVSEQEQCIRARMQFYDESREVAAANCEIILEDPLRRHWPPGLSEKPTREYPNILPASIIDTDLEKNKDLEDVDIAALQTCFAEKVKDGMDPREAVEECEHQVRYKKAEKEQAAKDTNLTVPDLFGKTPKEIEDMREKPLGGTVGDLYGKTRKQRLEEQKTDKNN